MVFESKPGETFILGASTWRIEEITHDRVLVSPAPGAPGKMPFWRGDATGRTVDLGRRIGELVREIRALPRAAALDRLVRHHDLDEQAAENLLRYLEDQASAPSAAVPDDRTVVVERTRDELGDWRICVLTPFGGQILAPWSMAIVRRAREQLGVDVETMWTNDGFVVRIPESEKAPDVDFLFPAAQEIEQLVIDQLGGTALFAAKFRECASRALLLPRRRPGGRTPLWQQRKRSSDLLAAASKYPSFPILLEAYRECLRDVFDLPALAGLLRDVERRQVRVVTVDSDTPSPFASAILFGYVANYLYEGDAPLAERRAQALSIDQAQLRELLGDLELRELLDADALAELERHLQHLADGTKARHADGLHDLLLRLGDLTREEIAARAEDPALADGWIGTLLRERRVIELRVGSEPRLVAVEDAARYRDALGAAVPPGLPGAFLEPVPDALAQLVLRYARTHGPFTSREAAARFGLREVEVDALLTRLNAAGRILEGAFRPGGAQREWCDPDVLRTLRRRSLARLRRAIEPVDPPVLGRFQTVWHGLLRRRSGPDAVLDAIEKLQGHPLPASRFERDVLAARVERYTTADLDALAGAGEVVWVGVEPLGERDGRIALYLTDALPKLLPPRSMTPSELTDVEGQLVGLLQENGASFFTELQDLAGGFPADLLDAVWSLVWKGFVTNDTFHPLRAYTRPKDRDRRAAAAAHAHGRSFRSRRQLPPTAGGRWSLVDERAAARGTLTEWAAATAWQLLARYGIVTREVAQAEGIPGGFTSLHDVFNGYEESGRIRRGYFVSDVGAMQFALPQVLDVLRSLRDPPPRAEAVVLAATDPANPYGALLKWPELVGLEGTRGPTRTPGAHVVLLNGALAAFLGRGGRQLLAWLPENEPDRTIVGRGVAERLAHLGHRGESVLVAEINGQPAAGQALARFLGEAGFTPTSHGLYLSRRGQPTPAEPIEAEPEDG